MNESIGYLRVSSEEQADSGLGLQAQRQRVVAFCDMKELRLADEMAARRQLFHEAVAPIRCSNSASADDRIPIALATMVDTSSGEAPSPQR